MASLNSPPRNQEFPPVQIEVDQYASDCDVENSDSPPTKISNFGVGHMPGLNILAPCLGQLKIYNYGKFSLVL